MYYDEKILDMTYLTASHANQFNADIPKLAWDCQEALTKSSSQNNFSRGYCATKDIRPKIRYPEKKTLVCLKNLLWYHQDSHQIIRKIMCDKQTSEMVEKLTKAETDQRVH